MNYKKYRFFLALLGISILLCGKGFPQDSPSSSPASGAEKPILVQASICANLKEGSPWNPGAVFPVNLGKVFCFSSFDLFPNQFSVLQSIDDLGFAHDLLVMGGEDESCFEFVPHPFHGL